MSDRSSAEYVDWSQFTGRPAVPLELGAARELTRGKRVLITGAGGSIGSALAKVMALLDASELILLDAAELGLHQLSCDLQATTSPPASLRLVVGSVCDFALVSELFRRHQPHIVFHAAACKHVPLMEANPFTAASVNILGTEIVTHAASAFGAEQCILLSTDKAVEPASVMGATKRIAELISLTSAGSTRHKVLRMGNVLGSSGSVAPLFLDEISRGGPLTVAHPAATRYFLSTREAVQRLLATMTGETGSGLFVPNMGEPHRIIDLAQFLIAKEGKAAVDVKVIFTGLRAGDKLSERLTSAHERLEPSTAHGLHRVATSELLPAHLAKRLNEMASAISTRHLGRLIEAIQSVVPNFHVGQLLRQEVDATSARVSL